MRNNSVDACHRQQQRQTRKGRDWPDLALTVFANELRRILSENSVRGYLRETLAFVNWCTTDPVTQRREWHGLAEPRKSDTPCAST